MSKKLPSEEDVKQAIKGILSDKKSYTKSLIYAIDYCRAGLYLSHEALRMQTLYILNNITHWRGTGNKEIRQLLKDFAANGDLI